MRRVVVLLVAGFACLTFSSQAFACPPDSVAVGPLCVDKYEASAWDLTNATDTAALISKIRAGTATLSDLVTRDAKAVGVYDQSPWYASPWPCLGNGNNCNNIFAVSIPGTMPSGSVTWFQAQQACGSAGKRLLTNAEWQMAAAGTYDNGSSPDFGRCVNQGVWPRYTGNAGPLVNGGALSCISAFGAEDMVGNVWEWVADWVQSSLGWDGGWQSTSDYGSDAIFGVNEAYPYEHRLPAALMRGGGVQLSDPNWSGVFALSATYAPAGWQSSIGFRCGR